MRRFALFVSGPGRAAIALLNADEQTRAPISLVVSTFPDSASVALAESLSIPTAYIPREDYKTKAAFERRLIEVCHAHQIDYIFLSGFRFKVGPTLLAAYPQQMFNIHPSLLPAYKGLDAIQRALADNVTETGITVHYVNEEIDEGETIFQTAIPVGPGDTFATVEPQVFAAGVELMKQTLKQFR